MAAYIDDFRISGLGSSDMVYYIRDLEGNVIAKYDGAGNLLAEYIYGNGRRVAKITPDDQIQYYLNDHPELLVQALGSARLLYGSGWSASYYPLGEVAAQAGGAVDNHFDFTGHERNRRTGLLYDGARYYTGAKRKSRMGGNPWLGRWLSVDPLAEEYPAWNPYNYTLGNPINHFDPDGRIVWGAIIGAAVEFGSQVATDMIVNDKSFVQAVKDVDYTDVVVAAGVGLATGGLGSLKAFGTIGKVGLQVVGNVAEGAVKANVGSKTNKYTAASAVFDGSIGVFSGAAGEVGKKIAQNSKTAKVLKKTAKRLANIAEKGRARPAQALRAAKPAKAAEMYGSGRAAQAANKVGSAAASEAAKNVNKDKENK